MSYLIKPEDAHVGMHINMWTVLSIPVKTRDKALCRCDCGKEKQVCFSNILSGLSKRCRHCSTSSHTLTHGESDGTGNTRLYRIWKAMKWRCNPKNATEDRKMYYERGISVCNEWMHDYVTFKNWALANGYNKDLSIDRFPNQNGNYEPSNCRWANQSEQCRNTRRNHMVTAFGETKSMTDWGEDGRCFPNAKTLQRRLALGWDAQKAVSTPVRVR